MNADSAAHPKSGYQDDADASGIRPRDEHSALGDGAVELFIKEFNLYESRSNLFSLCRDQEGFAWWDLVRYSVQFALCAEKGIYSFPEPGKNRIARRAYSFLSQSVALARDALKIAFLRGNSIGQAYVFSRPCTELRDELEKSGLPCFVVSDNGASSGAHVVIGKRSVDFFVRMVSRLVRPPEAVIAQSVRLGEEIREKFGSKLDVGQIILRKYTQHQAACIAWSLILSRLKGLEVIGFIGDDTLKTLVFLANARAIRTREFQHGYMGKSHVNYSYPELPVPVPTLPTEVMVYRDSGDIEYPVTLVRSPGAAMAAGESTPDVAKDIDVLIGGSPTRVAEAISIVAALAGRGLSLAVKLHPKQSESSSGIRKHFTSEQVRIYSSELDFSSLARRAKVYVPANPTSTTVFEAVENGAKLVVVDYDGVKMTSMLDAIVSERVGSFQDLHKAVLLHLHQETENTVVC